MKYLLAFALVALVLLGCTKEEPGVQVAKNVKIHEITVQSPDSTVTFWYVFYREGKFVYAKSKFPMDDFSNVFFSSSESIPKELKFTEEYVKMTPNDSGDTWGMNLVDTSSITVEDLTDSIAEPDSNIEFTPTVDSLPIDVPFQDNIAHLKTLEP